MKKIVMFMLPVLLIWACGNGRKETKEILSAENGDTLIAETDTLTEIKDEWPMEAEEEIPLPKSVDELFDDFIFEFAQNKRFQQERIQFPLPVIDLENDTSMVKKNEWQQEYLFLKQDYYTVLFNSSHQMDLEKSTDREHVTVEWLHLVEEYSKSYDFERQKGIWRLTGIRSNSFDDSPLSDFLRFYQHFSTDSIYQSEHIADPFRYTTEDPNDDMERMEGTLDAGQWQDFRPDLPADILTNVRYGQTYRDRNKMILLKRGISNGLMDILIFEKADDRWKLAAYEN
ncbi:MAG: DUF4348 domain-containing protein [Paraprevotella sp.]|nr:DUF4348 domain-containing protein [Paraprevotella sp.]